MDAATYIVALAAILVTAAASLYTNKPTWLTGGLLALACLIALIPALGYGIDYYKNSQARRSIADQTEPPSSQARIPMPSSPPVASPPREFADLNITPKYLVELYSSADMTVNAIKLVEPYIGKWLTFSGVVNNVKIIGEDDPSPMVSFLEIEPVQGFTIPNYHSVIMYFEKSWLRKIRTLAKGETITVRGRIAEIMENGLVFQHCELVEVTTP